ncbi:MULTISPECIES: hypothetical protein [Vagococcus]|uniref:Uncharacterized protein n=1 Tax=Vagococcus fluvialis bH819 TaxID=1255619 RepID=A0A1X6WNE8_9ENTE|nr:MULTISPECIES: hypothetical protein [Vagococcus]SLM85800.1 hypothetical protein FM121_06845 [Vagococcus fluvialis bH819]HCM90222.1 hypothetical protein [Vagococcus sp.]
MIKIAKSTNDHQESLNQIFEESIPYFLKVEGREPLKPLEDIREKIGNPPISINIIGRSTIELLDNLYRQKGINTCQLLVSGSNYLGLKFWTEIGFNKIVYVEAPDENSPTCSVETELERSF